MRNLPLVLFGLTVLVSAFLLFQVQPLISKIILPWFGGTPAVWTTCMLFFQVFLLLGYAYAHALVKWFPINRQGQFHLLLLVFAVCALPITPGADWKPVDSSLPTWRILTLLCVHVGFPYFLLASTGPLIQAWLAASGQAEDRSVYRLYALSNAGSLAALVSYPFVFEPLLAASAQGIWWSAGFVAFAVLCGGLAVRQWRVGPIGPTEPAARTNSGSKDNQPQVQSGGPDLLWKQRFAWLGLACLGSVLLLAVTSHVCQDVAVMPLLWVVPLALYLLTFILTFDSDRWYTRRWCGGGATLAVVLVSLNGTWQLTEHIVVVAGLFFALLFFACMVCHGELVRRKPSPQHLTEFYLWISAGGALGGVLTAVVCPLVFPGYWELPLSLLVVYCLAAWLVAKHVESNTDAATHRGRAVPAALFAGLVLCLFAQLGTLNTNALAAERNFYGVLQVCELDVEDPQTHGRVMVHGSIGHGFQFVADGRRKRPTMYYTAESGCGQALLSAGERGPIRVGAVGLGVGTVAAYARPGDVYRFYEINPDVINMAERHFTFLSECDGEVEMVLGDARLMLENEPPKQFDVLILDAFSGDAVPAHLLTVEAFAVYLRHLKPSGVIAANISNRHVNLEPVLAAVAAEFDLACRREIIPADKSVGRSRSHWIVMSKTDANTIGKPLIVPPEQRVLWTDDYNNLWSVLK